MNKKGLVYELAQGTGLTKVEVAAVVDGFMALVNRSLRDGQTVELRGFGTFVPVHRAQRRARDPVSGKVRPIPPRWTVTFRPSPKLKNAVNENMLSKA
jgi:DNA-binding protein HU-beta